MDLDFSVNKTPYLQKIFSEIRHQEETAESVVPDSFPDAAGIVDTYASVFLRGKEYHTGSAVISGAVKAGVIYHPEDNSFPRLIEYYVPFTVSFDSAVLNETSQIAAELKISSVDARMINSRKILLRVNIACEIAAYGIDEIKTYQLQSSEERLQLKKQKLSAFIPSEIAERTFMINETVDLSSESVLPLQIYDVRLTCGITDKKLIGNKAVFRGILQCKLLYLGENHKLYSHYVSLPFSQYCELIQDYDDGILSVTIIVTGCDLHSNQDGSQQLNVNLLSQCQVYRKYETEYIDDAYCTGGELTPQWSQAEIMCVLDRKTDPFSARLSVPGRLSEIIDVEIYDDFPGYNQTGASVQVTVPTFVRVLGYDENNVLCALHSRGEMSAQYPLSNSAACHVHLSPSEECSTQTGQTTTEVRCNFQGEACFAATQQITSLCGGSIASPAGKGERTPSVVLLSISEEQPLWIIAKTYRTTVDALQCANSLEKPYTPDHGMLLIPIP